MGRIPLLTPQELSTEQKQLYDAILGGPRSRGGTGRGLTDARGALVGPFNAWLFAPQIGERVQQLGAGVRFSSSLADNLLEVAILVMAREWSAQFEWWAHAILARRAGIAPQTIAAIKQRRRPDFQDPDEALVHDFSRELLEHRRVGEATYRQAVERLGHQGVVELVTVLGYYALISMTLNVFEVRVPEGQTPPFETEV